MRLFVELARRGFRQQSSYRAATIAGIFTNSVFGFVHGAILVAAVRSAGGRISGYGVAETLTYAWLGQALIGPIVPFKWDDIALRVQSGDIATDLARPADFQAWWLAADLGRGAWAVAFRAVPQFVVGAACFTLLLPSAAGRWAAFAASVVLAVVVSFALRFVANVLVFFTVEARGVLATHTLLMSAMSGLLLPLGFFPGWAAGTLRALPWAAVVQAPVDVFLGRRSVPQTLTLQFMWAIAILLLGRMLLGVAQRRLVVQGG
jgi:ABC-2 type transport system permease protein